MISILSYFSLFKPILLRVYKKYTRREVSLPKSIQLYIFHNLRTSNILLHLGAFNNKQKKKLIPVTLGTSIFFALHILSFSAP